MNALLVILAGLVIYRACLTVMFFPVRFWDFRHW